MTTQAGKRSALFLILVFLVIPLLQPTDTPLTQSAHAAQNADYAVLSPNNINQLEEIYRYGRGSIHSITYDSENYLLALGGIDTIWVSWVSPSTDLQRNFRHRPVGTYDDLVMSVVINSDKESVIGASGDGTVKEWSLREDSFGELLNDYSTEMQNATGYALDISPDGKWLAYSIETRDGVWIPQVRLINLDDDTAIEFETEYVIRNITFDYTSRYIFVGSEPQADFDDRAIEVFDIETEMMTDATDEQLWDAFTQGHDYPMPESETRSRLWYEAVENSFLIEDQHAINLFEGTVTYPTFADGNKRHVIANLADGSIVHQFQQGHQLVASSRYGDNDLLFMYNGSHLYYVENIQGTQKFVPEQLNKTTWDFATIGDNGFMAGITDSGDSHVINFLTNFNVMNRTESNDIGFAFSAQSPYVVELNDELDMRVHIMNPEDVEFGVSEINNRIDGAQFITFFNTYEEVLVYSETMNGLPRWYWYNLDFAENYGGVPGKYTQGANLALFFPHEEINESDVRTIYDSSTLRLVDTHRDYLYVITDWDDVYRFDMINQAFHLVLFDTSTLYTANPQFAYDVNNNIQLHSAGSLSSGLGVDAHIIFSESQSNQLFGVFADDGSQMYQEDLFSRPPTDSLRELHIANIRDMAFNPSGNLLATAEGQGILVELNTTVAKFHIWDVETQEIIQTNLGHDRPVTHIDFSPDGRFLMTASDDGTLRVWGVRN